MSTLDKAFIRAYSKETKPQAAHYSTQPPAVGGSQTPYPHQQSSLAAAGMYAEGAMYRLEDAHANLPPTHAPFPNAQMSESQYGTPYLGPLPLQSTPQPPAYENGGQQGMPAGAAPFQYPQQRTAPSAWHGQPATDASHPDSAMTDHIAAAAAYPAPPQVPPPPQIPTTQFPATQFPATPTAPSQPRPAETVRPAAPQVEQAPAAPMPAAELVPIEVVAEPSPTEIELAEAKAAEERAAAAKAAEEKAAELKAAELKAAELKAAELKAAELKAAEESAAEERAAEIKAAAEKAAAEKIAAEQAAAEAAALKAAEEAKATSDSIADQHDPANDESEAERIGRDVLQSAAQMEMPHVLELPSVFQSLGQDAEFASNRFAPDWEVDRFAWPEVCDRLLRAESKYFQQVGRRLRAATEEDHQVLLVGGCRRGEGRTTLALCLARCAAEAGIRVALFDADFANPQLGAQVGVETPCGWLEVVDGEAPLNEAAISSVEDGLTLFPLNMTNKREIDPHDERLIALLTNISSRYELVIVDSGPLGSDKRYPFCDANLSPVNAAIVVRDLRYTTEKKATATAEQLQQLGIEAVGIAENFRMAE